jgi:hypothetical protein
LAPSKLGCGGFAKNDGTFALKLLDDPRGLRRNITFECGRAHFGRHAGRRDDVLDTEGKSGKAPRYLRTERGFVLLKNVLRVKVGKGVEVWLDGACTGNTTFNVFTRRVFARLNRHLRLDEAVLKWFHPFILSPAGRQRDVRFDRKLLATLPLSLNFLLAFEVPFNPLSFAISFAKHHRIGSLYISPLAVLKVASHLDQRLKVAHSTKLQQVRAHQFA